jgi:hypothetical protein
MLGKSHFLKVSLKASYMSDKITQKTQYIAENTTVDGFQLPKGATFSTYGNVDGSVAVRSFLGWSTRIKPLKLNVNGTLGYDFARDPSYIEEKLNVAHRHDPYMFLYVTTNFSRRYVMELRSNTNLSVVLNSRYSDVSYLDQKVSLFSKNKITDWMFVNAQYTFVMRSPFHDAGVGLQDHMLNAIVGFALKKSGVEINLSCYDILNRTSSFKTTVVGNYTQTSFNPDFGRIWMVTAVWRFNSTKKGRGKVNFGFNSPTLGREYEDTRKIIDLHR